MAQGHQKKLRIVHISPMHFSENSYIGGGERYTTELARAMARINNVEVKLLTYGPERKTINEGRLKIEVHQPIFWRPEGLKRINSFSFSGLFKEILWSDVVFVHHYYTILANLAIPFAFLVRKKIFVLNYGGAGTSFYFLPFWLLVNKFLALTEFNRQFKLFNRCPKKTEVIYGGFDEKKFHPLGLKKEKKILFVGRILPHKGINYLIEAIDKHTKLVILGKKYDQKYFKLLKKIAKGKKVVFKTEVNDDQLVQEYNTALVTVLPSVYRDIYGTFYKAPELLGLTLLESMACGTPVICTDVGGMPYVVNDGKTGFIVPPNDIRALSEKIIFFLKNPEKSEEMGERARNLVENSFTWSKIAKKCLKIYETT